VLWLEVVAVAAVVAVVVAVMVTAVVEVVVVSLTIAGECVARKKRESPARNNS
jgi:hypothetical protein